MKKLFAVAIVLTAIAAHAAPRPFAVKDLGVSTQLKALGDRVLAYTLEPAGRNLWVSDGTARGTVKLIDGMQDLGPICGRFAYFDRWSEPEGWQVWRTDGTPGGTRRVALGELTSGACFGDTLVYAVLKGQVQVYRTSGDGSATTVPLAFPREAGGLTAFRGEIWFGADTSGVGADDAIWKADLATGALTRIASALMTSNPVVAGDTLFFFAGGKLWRSDGTSAGTVPFFPAPGFIQRVFAFHDLFFFLYNFELWRSDGTAAGTYKLAAVGRDQSIAVYRDALWFGAAQTLWKTDGTLDGRQPAVALFGAGNAIDPLSLTVAGDSLYFTDQVGPDVLGDELWRTDGTTAELVADLQPGPGGSSPRSLTAAGPFLFFTAQTFAFGNELWALPVGPIEGFRRRAR